MRALLVMVLLWIGLFVMLAPIYHQIEEVRATLTERARQLESNLDQEQMRIVVLEEQVNAYLSRASK